MLSREHNMLITLSGSVGSGKTTAADAVVNLLSDAGFRPRRLRFRYLRLPGFANPGRRDPAAAEAGTATETNIRHKAFRLRRLTATRTMAYGVRILAFRLSRIGAAATCDVLDRYFYDNLVQYSLSSWRERVYARALGRLIPVPDLAIVLIAADDTIAARRRNYAREYVTVVGHQYRELTRLFPHLKKIRTDQGDATEEIRQLVQTVIDRVRTS
jgi:thymidylate kinase